MKKIITSSFAIVVLVMITSCSSYRPAVYNFTNSETQVVLSENNFETNGRVSGTVTARYIFGIGGLLRKGLAGEATTKMYDEANLTGSQIIIDKHIEFRTSNFIPGIWGSIKATATGTLIEFK
tara:strand:- start:763 stop:1131 length:369 start_codon:yes stop_codon:yes gene_type:complete